MMMYRKLVLFLDALHHLVYPGIGKLLHLSAFLTNQVLVVLIVESLLILGDIVPELMFDDQPAIQQKLYGIVKRRPAHPVILVLHENIERLNIKMSRMLRLRVKRGNKGTRSWRR